MKFSEYINENTNDWDNIPDNSTKKINRLNKPFSESLRKDEKLAKDILISIVKSVKKNYRNHLTEKEVFNLIKKIVDKTTLSDFNWDDEDLYISIEQNL